LSRRSVLLSAAVAAAVTACTDEPAESSPTPPPPSPDELLRRVVVAAEADLIALYAATRAAHPQLADALAPVEDRHRRHFDAVAASGRVAVATRPRATANPTQASATATPSAPPLPTDPAAALDALRSAEHTAAEARLKDCLSCKDPALAELVAAVAAGEAANAVLLSSAS
jgi:ferritin-like protein